MNEKLRWGILGTGNIARQFCAGVNASQRGVLAGVGSRSAEAAASFASTYHIAACDSYENLLANPDVQAVYVSLPNALHHEWTIRALRAGKHVLCEKPFAISVAQSEEMFDVAKRAGRVVIEAFMYRAQPLMHAVLAAVRSGAIGQVKLVRTSFCFRTTQIDANVRFKPELVGGALMDVGCYCINFSRLIAAEEPAKIAAFAELHPTGVDHVSTGMMSFPGGILASFTCGMSVQTDNTAYICGTEGYIEIPIPWKPPASGAVYHIVRATPPRMDQPGLAALSSAPNSGPRQTFAVDAPGELYAIEADDFAATVFDGKIPMISREDTIGNMRVLDEMRRQIGVL